jgi:hypothetical protein
MIEEFRPQGADHVHRTGQRRAQQLGKSGPVVGPDLG